MIFLDIYFFHFTVSLSLLLFSDDVPLPKDKESVEEGIK